MSLAIVYLNYYSSNQIKSSIDSIINQLQSDDHIYIGDNSDDEIEYNVLLKLSSRYVTVINNYGNIGFSAGCNKIVSEIKNNPEWILLLNPDTLVKKNFIENFIKSSSTLSMSYSAISPKGLKMGTNETWSSGGKFYWHRGRADVLKNNRNSGDTKFGTCACLFVRFDDFVGLNGLDEDYFLGGEEWQLSIDVYSKLKNKIFYDQNIVYEHAISGTHEKYGLRYFYIGIRTKLIFVSKNYTWFSKKMFWLVYIPYHIYWSIKYSIKYNVKFRSLILATITAFKLNGDKLNFSEIKNY